MEKFIVAMIEQLITKLLSSQFTEKKSKVFRSYKIGKFRELLES